MKTKNKLATAVGLSLGFLTLTSPGYAIERHERPEVMWSEVRAQREAAKEERTPEIVQWAGTVKCEHMGPDGECSLKFIRDDGEEFDLEEDQALRDAYCERKADMKVKLSAEKTSKFLFWGGNLKVKGFQIAETLKTGSCEVAAVEPRAFHHGGASELR